MPSIIIRERDNTTVPAAEYNNFAVVVPGAYDKEIGIAAFDENGIYECTSQEDFENNVGLVSIQNIPAQEAEYAKPTVINEEGTTFESIYTTLLTAEEYYRSYYGQTYVVDASASAIGPGKGHYKYVPEVGDEEYYIFTPSEEYDSSTPYVILTEGNEGKDEVEGTDYGYTIMGNQIAYELLGLGYTVLYKKIDYIENTDALDIEKLETPEYWECLLDRSTYDFRYITLGGYNDADAQELIAAIAREKAENDISDNVTGRGDCTALIDIDDGIFNSAVSQKEAAKKIEAYAYSLKTIDTNTALFAPTVEYSEANEMKSFTKEVYNNNHTFPASFHYLACAAFARKSYAEWYAVAGYQRGVSSYYVEGVGYKFGDIAVNLLAPRSYTPVNDTDQEFFRCVNLVSTEKDNYYIWGNRTAKALTSGLKAGHFLNIRQLCTTIKKRYYVLCKQFSFDPNSDLLWVNFCAEARPTLDNMKADQGLDDYELLKVENRERAKLTVYVRIVPVEAVEDFDITLFLEDSLNGSTSVSTTDSL